MEVDRRENRLVINLTSDEVFAVQAGRTIGERGGLLLDSKVEILPLGKIMVDDSDKDRWNDSHLEKAQTTPLYARILPNQDLQIGIPEIVLSDVRVSDRIIRRGEILVFDEEIRELLPEEGVKLNFRGSLQVIDLYPQLVS